MSSSRLFSLFSSSIFHHRTALTPSSPTPLNLFYSRIPPLRFRRYTSSATVSVDSVTSTEPVDIPSDSYHPWPEWVDFVDRLKAKGYIHQRPSSPAAVTDEAEDDSGGDSKVDGDIYKDITLLKDATLCFARDRFDLFKLLSKEDIQTVVGSGCPNIFRKAVNSAKRLRAYVQLDEGDVCGACNLRGSCDRAYVILKDSESTARTIDVVRILLFHALDPLVVLGGDKPSQRVLVETSARNLLSHLIKLSETPIDPNIPKVEVQATRRKERTSNSMDDEFSKDVEMKRGDWMCSKCNFLNFAKNIRCLKCNEDGPRRVGSEDAEMKKGDWTCPECSFMNFSRNTRCLKCKTKGPEKVGVDDIQMKKGDWNCPSCSFMNFASNRKCLRCREDRPKRQLNPGEWECPSCDFLNYKRNVVCLKCDCERPKEAATQYEEQTWRPRLRR